LLLAQGEYGAVNGRYHDPQVGLNGDERSQLDPPIRTVQIGSGPGQVAQETSEEAGKMGRMIDGSRFLSTVGLGEDQPVLDSPERVGHLI
jgi:hypothetical protein